MVKQKKFVTAINCMDGRTQLPVVNYLMEKYNVSYVDMITEAGPNKVLSDYHDLTLIDSIKHRVDVSVNLHKSKVIAIVGHYDCGGNPSICELQKEQIIKAMENIKKWNYETEVIGLWLNEDFIVSEVISNEAIIV